MKHSAIRSRVAVLVLGAALVTPGVWAAESRAGRVLDRAAATPKIVVLRLWDQLTAFWDEDGSFIDPYGGKATSPEPTLNAEGESDKAGSFIDPDGSS